jgi:hypothetical protein
MEGDQPAIEPASVRLLPSPPSVRAYVLFTPKDFGSNILHGKLTKLEKARYSKARTRQRQVFTRSAATPAEDPASLARVRALIRDPDR